MTNVLIIGRDEEGANGLAAHLRGAGFDPLVVTGAELGLARLRRDAPRACVLDAAFGEGLVETARAEGIRTPFVVVSTGEPARELVTSVQNAARRGPGGPRRLLAPLVLEELVIDPAEADARVDGRSANLTPTEFRLLLALALERGRIVGRDELMERIWGRRQRHRDRTVDVFVRRVREKIDRRAPRHDFVHTHRGVGYEVAARPKT